MEYKKITKRDAQRVQNYMRKAYDLLKHLEDEAGQEITMYPEIGNDIENMLGGIQYVVDNSIY